MAGKTFTDELAILNSQNFLGGLAEMGTAMKEGLQNKTLVQLFNEFQIEKKGLETSGEQLSNFNKKYESSTDKEGFLTRGAPPNKLNADLQATVNLFGYMEKQKAYLGTYEPFIQAFAVLGEDGVKIAKQLTDELGRKLTLEESKGQIPFKQLEYDMMKTNFDWTKDKYGSWLKDDKLKQDSFTASDYIMKSDVFDLIEGGDITTWKGERLKKHNVAIQTVIDDAKKHFGNQLSDSAILAGLKMAMDYTGKSFKFVEKQDFSGNSSGAGFSGMELAFMKGNLQQWSTRWNNMNDSTKNYFREYMQDPVAFKTKYTEYNTTDAGFEEMYEIYKPGGQYAQYWTILSGIDPTFNKMGVQSVDGKPRVLNSGGKEVGAGTQMNMPFTDQEIIRMKDGSSFTNNDFSWNPQWVRNYKGLKQDEWKRRLDAGNSFDYIYDEGLMKPKPVPTYNTGIKKISNMSKK